MKPTRIGIVTLALFHLCLSFLCLPLFAQGTAPVVTEEKDPKAFLYVVPQGSNPKDYVDFLIRLQQFQAASPEELQEYQAKAPTAVRAAAEQLLKLVKDENDEMHRMAKHVLLSHDIQALYRTTDARQHIATTEQTIKHLGTVKEFGQDQVSMVVMLADALEHAAPPEVSTKYLPQLAEVFDKTQHPQLMEQAEQMRATTRRLRLLGNEMPFKGKTFAGQPLDVSSLQGKVVLIDYWATWAEFCVEQMPRMAKLHAAYKDRGFEIVGVSLDEDRAVLEAFLKEHKLPWIIVNDEEHKGMHPSVKEYGIFGLPTTILIGKDGKVVTFDAHGEQLQVQLNKLLGPIAPDEKPAAPAAPTAPAAGPATAEKK